MAKLCLHSGGKLVEPEVLHAVPTPEPVGVWRPIPHHMLFDLVTRTICDSGLRIENVQMGIDREGARFFALMDMSSESSDYRLVIGLRNSHDKKFPAGLAIGSSVFVCDNLAFSGEIAIARKHTLHITRDLPGLVVGAVGRIAIAKQSQEKRIELYKGSYIDNFDAHDLVIKSVDYGVIPNAAIPQVLKEWREPTHKEFEPRTVWSLFNGFTEVCKRFPVSELPKHTTKLHGMFDSFCGLDLAE